MFYNDDELKAQEELLKELRSLFRHDIDAKALMSEITPALSLSYIAEKYFGKGRSWLYQRINNATVNGKQVAFTTEELKTLADSFSDLSNRLSALSFVIHRSL